MNQYLRDRDVFKQISSDNLNQIIDNNITFRWECEREAIEEISSYLTQRFDIEAEFKTFGTYSSSQVYYSGDRVYIHSDITFATSSVYNTNDEVKYTISNVDYVYLALQTNGASPSNIIPGNDPSIWQLLGAQDDIYYNINPALRYDHSKAYRNNSSVLYNGYIYKSNKDLAASFTPIDTNGLLRGGWELIGPETTTTGIYVTNSSYWIKGDDRSAQMVMMTTDIMLYHLHSRINPRNIPKLREDRYMECKRILESFAMGKATPNLLARIILNESSVVPIVWGSSGTKLNNLF